MSIDHYAVLHLYFYFGCPSIRLLDLLFSAIAVTFFSSLCFWDNTAGGDIAGQMPGNADRGSSL